MFQKVNDWLADKGERIAHGGNANKTSSGAYYASNEAEQAYSGLRNSPADTQTPPDSAMSTGATGRVEPVDRFSGDSNDKYSGRVPYRSQRDMQAEADSQRQQQEDQARRQQSATQQRQAQPFGRTQQQGYSQAQPAPGPAGQQPGNILQFPGMIRGPEGNLYAHVEYVVLLRSRNECTKVIEYIKANASVFLNMEFIANDSERQRCVDMLSGAAYTLGCRLNKISQRGIYLISSPSVCVVIDPAMQKYASAPEAQGYVRPEYANYGAYGNDASAQGYTAQQAAPGYAAPVSPGYGTVGARSAAYAQPSAGYDNRAASGTTQQPTPVYGAVGTRTAAYAQPSAGYGNMAASGATQQPTPVYGTAAYAQPSAGYGNSAASGATQQPTPAYGAAGTRTAAYAQPSAGYGNAGRNDATPPASAYTMVNQTGSYAAQPATVYGAGIHGSDDKAHRAAVGSNAQPSATAPQAGATPRRATTPFGMQGAFVKSGENSASGASR